MFKLGYNSVRFIRVEDYRLALLHYILQGVILLYVLVYAIVIQKGYQEYDQLVGVTSIKMKGSGLGADGMVYDSYDLNIPPLEVDAFFVTTAFTKTLNQTRGVCVGEEECTTNANCTANEFTDNGILTGACDTEAELCLVQAWCDLEDDSNKTVVSNVGNWTAFVKVDIEFPKFGVTRTNAESALIPGVNLFRVADIVDNTGATFADVVEDGAIVLVQVNYDCDLNQDVEKCLPEFSFHRLDQGRLSKGFNYRYTVNTFQGDVETRTLIKVYGIRVIFRVSGQAGRFNIVPLLLNLGSGLALLGVATVVCDFLLQNLLPNRQKYVNEKFSTVEDAQSTLTLDAQNSGYEPL